MKRILLILILSFFLIGCTKEDVTKKEEINQNNLTQSEEKESHTINNNQEQSSFQNVGNTNNSNNQNTNQEEAVINYFKEVEEDVDVYLLNTNDESISDKIKNSLITCIDFLFYEKPIKGVYFNDLTEKTKNTLHNMMMSMDEKIEKRFPNYKEYWQDKYKVVKDKVKEYIDKADIYLEDKIGKDEYQDYKDTASKVWDITKDVGNDIVDGTKNIWGNIKSWYENATNKN